MDARTEEIRARVEKDLDMWARRLACYNGVDRQELEKRQAWFRSELEQFTTAELTALREEVERLRGALTKYGGHHLDCDQLKLHGGSECTCGFDAALSPSPAQQEPK